MRRNCETRIELKSPAICMPKNHILHKTSTPVLGVLTCSVLQVWEDSRITLTASHVSVKRPAMARMPSQLPETARMLGFRLWLPQRMSRKSRLCRSHVPDTELFQDAGVGAYMPQTAARSPETTSMLGSGPVAAPARGLLARESGAPLAKGLA